MKVGVATLLLASVVLPHASEVQALSDELLAKCKRLGFSEALRCTTCRHIEEIVADPGLTAECLQCCQEAKSPSKKYASATLVYDPRLLSADPELKGFVNDRAADHPALKLKPSLYAKTVLLMSEEGADERDAETVSIRRWKVDSISDYLREHL